MQSAQQTQQQMRVQNVQSRSGQMVGHRMVFEIWKKKDSRNLRVKKSSSELYCSVREMDWM